MPQSQFTWKGEKSRALAVKRPCDCGCDQRDGGHGVGYLTGSDAEGNGVTVWIEDEQVFQALRAMVAVQAAAPEMLEALEGVISRIMDSAGGADLLPVDEDNDPENYRAISEARAAIAKAKGE